MARPGTVAAALAGAALTLVACGSSGSAPRCTPTPRQLPPVVANGPVSATADRPTIPLGATAHFTVKVVGPATYQAPCDGPVRMIVVDSSDIHLLSDTPPAPRGTACGAVTLAPGQHAEYGLDWTVDPTLPPGVYRILLTLGDQPDLVLPVHVGEEFGGCSIAVSG